MKGLEQQRVQHRVDTKFDGVQALQVIEVMRLEKIKSPFLWFQLILKLIT